VKQGGAPGLRGMKFEKKKRDLKSQINRKVLGAVWGTKWIPYEGRGGGDGREYDTRSAGA